MQNKPSSYPRRLALPALALMLSMLACNLPSVGNSALNETGTALASTQTELVSREMTDSAPTLTPAAPTLTDTPAPSDTPSETATVTLTPTPTYPTYTATQAVNCRYGPSTGFDARFTLSVGDVVEIIGRSNMAYWANWWKVVYQGTECWVSDGYGTLSGDLGGIPVLNVATFTPTYTPSVTPTFTVTYTPTPTNSPTP
ncbi:MAG: SH3 domain-containing protein [Anaerolineae bacterium]|nr:SH3 domain-containing protein [Anaerolineae bacterium]